MPAAAASIPGGLRRPLLPEERRLVASEVRAWLDWQEGLTRWRAPRSAIDAMPFVGLYANGALRGCIGNREAHARERLPRAFLAALADARFGGVRPVDRASLAAEVTFMRDPRFASGAELDRAFELGTHGLGLWRERGGPVFLLPSVARDSGLDAAGMLEALRRKAGPGPASLFFFESESVVARRGAPSARSAATKPSLYAAAWLASLVQRHGVVAFGVDARTGARVDVGKMHHGRGASVLHALGVHGGHRAAVARGRARMALEIRHALAGTPVDGWPETAAEIAGTLALAVRADVPVRDEATRYVTTHAAQIAGVPWHAAQVVAALGRQAPESLWRACLDDSATHPWAPWTVLAGAARGEPVERVAPALEGLAAAVRSEPPHEGAVIANPKNGPEVAITALTVEALRAYPTTPAAEGAIARARRFLARQQLLPGKTPAAFVTVETEGAFLTTPTATLLRGDVTAHALLALA